ncbi:MAG: tyrosine-type recombinase/integrase [Pseudonocardiaceae bacterium]
MASIKKRGTRWFARYRDNTGREHAQRFDRKVDAQNWLDERTAALVTGQYADPRAGRVVFRQYAEQWRSTMVHGPSTRNLVERTLRCHIYPALGDLPMGSIRTTTVQALVTELSGRLAASTLKLAYGYMVAVFRAAVRDRIIASSPCEGVRLPPPRRKQVEIPPLEVLDILAANLPPRFAVVPELVAGSGLRQGELFGLEVDAVTFLGSRAVSVHQQLVCLSPHPPYLGPVKTAESERVVPLAQVTLNAVAAHLAAFPATEVTISDRTDPRKPVSRPARLLFTMNDGQPVTRHAWSAVWIPAARAAGLPPRTGLHALRHLYASLLIRHGESVKTVQKQLGHSSAAITLDTYAHIWPDADDRTREAVEQALAKIDRAADTVRTEGRSS